MSEKWIPVLFALGLLYGRKSYAKPVEVPPRIIHIPPPNPAPSGNPLADLEDIVNKLSESSYHTRPKREELIKIAEKVKQILDVIQRRDLYLRRIEELSKAFMEDRISQSVYAFLVEFYQEKLIEAELNLKKLIEEAELNLRAGEGT